MGSDVDWHTHILIWHGEAELEAEAGRCIGSLREPDMLEEFVRNTNPPILHIQPIEAVAGVGLHRGTRCDEEAGLGMRRITLLCVHTTTTGW